MINCERCNSNALTQLKNGEYECKACGAIFSATVVQKYTDAISGLLSEIEQKNIANARKNLWNEVNKPFLCSSEIIKWANEIQKYLPNDFYASLYRIVCSGNTKQLNEFIGYIDAVNHYNEIEYVVEFILRAVVEESLLSLNNLIERTYKEKDLELYEKITTKLAIRAKEVNEGIYNVNLQRDVFVAYKSEDMRLVEDIVAALESSGLSCFVSMRNLQHGRGAVENYRTALERAIDNCKTFLFVSTEKARNFSCDAVKFELPYIKYSDIQKNPMYRDNYETMPLKYKKFRVQLVFGGIPDNKNAADRFVNSIFNGYEYAYSVEEAADRISQNITSRIVEEIKDSDEKICLNCGSENKLNAVKCVKCGEVYFCDTIDEYRDHLTEKTNKLIREKAELDKKVEEERAALLKQIDELKKASEQAKTTVFQSEEKSKIGTHTEEEKTRNPKIDKQLDNARSLIENEDYSAASLICNNIHALDAENPELWILRTLIEVKQNRLYKVAKLNVDLTKSLNFQKAVRYGKGEEIEKLKKAVAQALKNYNESNSYTQTSNDPSSKSKWQPIVDTTKKIADIIDEKRKKIELETERRKTAAEEERQREEELRRRQKEEKYYVKSYSGSSIGIIVACIIIMALEVVMNTQIFTIGYPSKASTLLLLFVGMFVTSIWLCATTKDFHKCRKYAAIKKIKGRTVFSLFTLIFMISNYCLLFTNVLAYFGRVLDVI